MRDLRFIMNGKYLFQDLLIVIKSKIQNTV
jgi:hypothetical protein